MAKFKQKDDGPYRPKWYNETVAELTWEQTLVAEMVDLNRTAEVAKSKENKMSAIAPVMTTDDWLKKHEGHDIRQEQKQVSIKLLKYHLCLTCNAQHLYDMETIINRGEDEQP